MSLIKSKISTMKRVFHHKWQIFLLSILVTLIFSFIINFYYEKVYRIETKVGTEYRTSAPRSFFANKFVDINPRDFFYNNINIIKQNKNFYNFCKSTFQKNCEKIILKNIVIRKVQSNIYHNSDNYNLEFVIRFYFTSPLENFSLEYKEIFSNYIAYVFDNAYNNVFEVADSIYKKKLQDNQREFIQYFSSLKNLEEKDKQLAGLKIARYIDSVNTIKDSLILINKNKKEKIYRINIMHDKKLFFSNNKILLSGLFVFSLICFTILFSNKK